MKNIHVLPTSQPSRLYLHSNGEIQIRTELSRTDGYLGKNQHMYITSSEEIKDRNCWVTNGKDVFKPLDDYSLEYANSYWQKIILTTDQDLINVEAIQDDFLEWFVNNPSCEFVEVVKEMYMPQSNGKISDGKITHELSLNESLNTLPFYRIIIPKQKLTLEEAARKYANIIHNRPLDDEERYYKDYQKYDGFVAGAKYQADDIIDKLYIHIISNEDDWSRNPQVEFKSFVEQFKKK